MQIQKLTTYVCPETGDSISIDGLHSEKHMQEELQKRRSEKNFAAINNDEGMKNFLQQLVRA
jgi:hypothetical protein